MRHTQSAWDDDCARRRRTVLIVDDHAVFRSLARSLLEAEGFEVVGEAPDGRSAIDAALQLRPDIVLLDVQLPDLDGFTVAERLAAIDPDRPAVVLVSSRDSASYRRRLAATPARGFITKSQLSGSALSALVA
jgi:DNA-binding NarL/FixJ family response regulator